MIAQGFDLVPFTQQQLHDALRAMCPTALKAYDPHTTAIMRAQWSPERPTRFCCYFVSEMVYWYVNFRGPLARVRPMALTVLGDDTLHRYIQTGLGRIDLTCDQFDGGLNYNSARERMFMQTGGYGPSKRAQQLAELLKLERVRA